MNPSSVLTNDTVPYAFPHFLSENRASVISFFVIGLLGIGVIGTTSVLLFAGLGVVPSSVTFYVMVGGYFVGFSLTATSILLLAKSCRQYYNLAELSTTSAKLDRIPSAESIQEEKTNFENEEKTEELHSQEKLQSGDPKYQALEALKRKYNAYFGPNKFRPLIKEIFKQVLESEPVTKDLNGLTPIDLLALAPALFIETLRDNLLKDALQDGKIDSEKYLKFIRAFVQQLPKEQQPAYLSLACNAVVAYQLFIEIDPEYNTEYLSIEETKLGKIELRSSNTKTRKWESIDIESDLIKFLKTHYSTSSKGDMPIELKDYIIGLFSDRGDLFKAYLLVVCEIPEESIFEALASDQFSYLSDLAAVINKDGVDLEVVRALNNKVLDKVKNTNERNTLEKQTEAIINNAP